MISNKKYIIIINSYENSKYNNLENLDYNDNVQIQWSFFFLGA